MLPSKKTLFPEKQSMLLPPDFTTQGSDGFHAKLLKNVTSIKNNTPQLNVMAMHIDEVNIKEGFMFSNRNQYVGPAANNTNLLADSMQAFLLSSTCGKHCEFNVCTKPVKNMNGKELYDFLMEAIKKSYDSGFDLVAAIFDGGTSNRKCVRLLVDKFVNDKMNFKLPTYFTFDNKKIYIIFCIIHNIHYSK